MAGRVLKIGSDSTRSLLSPVTPPTSTREKVSLGSNAKSGAAELLLPRQPTLADSSRRASLNPDAPTFLPMSYPSSL